MKTKLRLLFIVFSLMLSLAILPACGGDNGSGGGGDEPPAQVEYTLMAEVNPNKAVDYSKETNTLTIAYGDELNIYDDLFIVKLVGSNGSSTSINRSFDENSNSGYVVDLVEYYTHGGAMGAYTINFYYKTYSTTINLVVNQAVVKKPYLEQTSFEYSDMGGVYIADQQYLKDFDMFRVNFIDNSTQFATNVGKYDLIFSLRDKNNCVWEDGTTDDIKLSWEITPKEISAPVVYQTEFTYEEAYYPLEGSTGIPKTLEFDHYSGYYYFTISSEFDDATQTEAGKYTTRLLIDNPNYTINGKPYCDIEWEIKPISLDSPSLQYTTSTYAHEFNELTENYMGISQTNHVLYQVGTENYIYLDPSSSSLTNTNSGTYTYKFTTKNTNYVFSENHSTMLELNWVICPMQVLAPTLLNNALTYQDSFDGDSVVGVEQEVAVDYHGIKELFTISSGSLKETNAGTYSVIISLIDKENYLLSGSSSKEQTLSFTIAPKEIISPTIQEKDKYLTYAFNRVEDPTEYGQYIYNAINQKPTISGITDYLKVLTTVENNGAALPNESPYHAIVKLNQEHKNNYVFSTTKSNQDLYLDFYIEKIIIDITNLTIKPGSYMWYVDSPAFLDSEIYMAAWCPDEKMTLQFENDYRLLIDYKIDGTFQDHVGAVGSYLTLASFEYPSNLYKVATTIDGVLTVIDTDGRYEEEFSWEIKKQTVDMKNMDWNYGDLLYTGEEITTPFIDGEYILTCGIDLLEKLTNAGFLAEIKEVYTLYKLNEVSGEYEIFNGTLKDKGKYKIQADLIYNYRHVGANATGEIRQINIADHENFILVNAPSLTTYFEIGKVGIDVKTLFWENVDTLEYNNGTPLAPALITVDERLSYNYTYYDEEGNQLPSKPSNAGKYKVKVEFIYDSENYQLLNLFIPTEVDFEIKKQYIDEFYVELNVSDFTFDGTEKSVSLFEDRIPSGVKVESITGTTSATNVGTYTLTVILSAIDPINFEVKQEITLTWTISPCLIDATGFNWIEDQTEFTFNATPITYTLPTAPTNLNVDSIDYYKWENNAWVKMQDYPFNAGKYKVNIAVSYDQENYSLINYTIKEREFVISPIYYGDDDFTWTSDGISYVYSGEEFDIPTLSSIPNFVEVSYTYTNENGQPFTAIKNAGVYNIQAVITSLYPESVIVNTTKNQVSVEIAKKQISMLGVQWGPYTSYTFTEEPIDHYLEITTLPEEIKGITYKYYRIADDVGNPVERTEVEYIYDHGRYFIDPIFDIDKENVEVVDVTTYGQYITVYKANFPYYRYTLNYEVDRGFYYDGQPHYPMYIDLPSDCEQRYYGLGETEVGSHSITLYLWGYNYNYTSVDVSFSIYRTPINPSELLRFEQDTFEYDGTAKTPVVIGGDDSIFTFEVYYWDSLTQTNAGTYVIEFYANLVDYEHYSLDNPEFSLTFTITPKIADMSGARWIGDTEIDFQESGLDDIVPRLGGCVDNINFFYEDYYFDTDLNEYVKFEWENNYWFAGTFRRVFSVEKNTNYILSGYTEEEMSIEFVINKIDFDWSNIVLETYRYGKNGEFIVTNSRRPYGSDIDYFSVPIWSVYNGSFNEWPFINLTNQTEVGCGLGDIPALIYIKYEGDCYNQTTVGKYHTKLTFTVGREKTDAYNLASKTFEYDWYVLGSDQVPYGNVMIGDTTYTNYEFLDIDTIDLSPLLYSNVTNKSLKIQSSKVGGIIVSYHHTSGSVTERRYSRSSDNWFAIDLIGYYDVYKITFSLTSKMPEKTIYLISGPPIEINGQPFHYYAKGLYTTAYVNPLENDGDNLISIAFKLSNSLINPFIEKTYTDLFNQYIIWVADDPYGETLHIFTENDLSFKSSLSRVYVMFMRRSEYEGYLSYDFYLEICVD